MSSPSISLMRNPALWLAASLALAGISRAREFLPVLDDREVERVDSRVQMNRAPRRDGGEGTEEAHEGWNLALVVSAAYDDNINLAQINKKSDIVVGLTPEVEFHKGKTGSEAENGNYVRFAYRPTVVLYMQNNGEDRVDQHLAFSAGWRGKTIAVAYDGSFRRLGDATADVGKPTDRDEYASEARVVWSPREKIAMVASVGVQGTDYDNSALADSNTVFGQVALRYAYSPKTKLAAICRIGRDDVTGASAQNIQRAVARIDWLPREKINLALEAGFEHRSFDSGSDTNPVVESRIDWRPRKGTELFLAGYLRNETSALQAGENYSLGGVRAGVSESLGHGWTASLEGGYERASYKRVSGSGPTGRVDRIYFVRPGLDYELNDKLNIGLFYQFSKDRSNRPGFSFADHQAGVVMRYEF